MATAVQKPKSVVIGPFDFDFVWKPITEEVLEGQGLVDGTIDQSNQLIYIDSSLAKGMQRETSLHEILHGIFLASNLTFRLENIDPDLEEEIIRALSPALLALIRSNPQMVKFWTEK